MNFKNLFIVLILVMANYGCSRDVKIKKHAGLKDYLNRAESFGFSGAVHFKKKDSVLLHDWKGFSDKERKIENSDSSLFYIASVSKSFTSAAIIKLEDQRKLKTTDSLAKFFKKCPIDKQNITIHQLLTHTSGIQSFGWNSLSKDWKILSKEQTIKGVLNSELSNSSFNYNNANYILLAAIIEELSNSSYQDFIKKEFLKPLQMQSTFFGFDSDEDIRDLLSNNFMEEADSKSYLDYPKSWLRVGGGDIISTASDLSKWIIALYTSKIISDDGKSKLFSIQQQLDANYGYGYGWYIREFPEANKKVIFHTGSFQGYSAEIRYYPESDVSLVVLSNTNSFSNITEVISNDLLSVVKGDSIRIPLVDVSFKNSKQFTGTFYLDSLSLSHISIKKNSVNRFIAQLFGQEAMLLISADTLHYQTMQHLNHITYQFLTDLSKEVKGVYEMYLPKEDIKYLSEYEDEWGTFIEKNKFRFLVNHTVFLGNDIYRTYATLIINGKEKYFGFTWRDNRLIGTAPNEKFNIPLIKLLAYRKNELVNYDWNKKESRSWRFYKKENDSIYIKIKLDNYIIKGYKK